MNHARIKWLAAAGLLASLCQVPTCPTVFGQEHIHTPPQHVHAPQEHIHAPQEHSHAPQEHVHTPQEHGLLDDGSIDHAHIQSADLDAHAGDSHAVDSMEHLHFDQALIDQFHQEEMAGEHCEQCETPWLDPAQISAFHAKPYEQPTHLSEFLEFGPTLLTKPSHRLAKMFGNLLHLEHDHVDTHLEEVPLGLHPIPERPPLLIELNEQFLAPGVLRQGKRTKSGAIWRPSLWVFGQYRAGIHFMDRDRANDPVFEYAHRLDLFAQLNLSGTERILAGFRPFDEEEGGARRFSSFDFRNGRQLSGYNAKVQTLFFEGDFGELFPNLDFHDTRSLDIGFSVGRMPLLAQQGLLLNEDMIDAVTMTRNTLNGNGNLNLRMTGVYSWNGINRNSATGQANDYDPRSRMYAILTESDFAHSTVNLDAVYVDGGGTFGNMFAVAASSIRRHHLFENTYNTSVHFLASFPTDDPTSYSDQGELLFAQTSWTPHHTEDLIYLNAFWAIDQFTSPSRGPAAGTPLGQTGILFSGVALGRYGAPLAATTNNTTGASLGYQWFYDHTRSQIIWEVGGIQGTKDNSASAMGSGLRFQKACGQHTIFVIDGFLAKEESRRVAEGVRAEILLKF